jgi:hypothetical protein
VRHVDLEHVEAGVGHDPCRARVGPRDPADVRRCCRSDHLHAQRGRHLGRGEGVHAVRPAIGHRSGMAELAADLCSGLVDRLGESRQTGGRLVVDDDDLLLRAPLRGHGQVGDCGQADTASGRSQVVVDQLVGDQTVRRAPLERGRLDRPVAEPDGAEGCGRKDVVHDRRHSSAEWRWSVLRPKPAVPDSSPVVAGSVPA